MALIELTKRERDRLLAVARSCTHEPTRKRYLVVCYLAGGLTPTEAAKATGVNRVSVYKIAKQFKRLGEAGLKDKRIGKTQGCYLPTREEIEQKTEEIKRAWPKWKRERQRVGGEETWQIPVVSTRGLS